MAEASLCGRTSQRSRGILYGSHNLLLLLSVLFPPSVLRLRVLRKFRRLCRVW